MEIFIKFKDYIFLSLQEGSLGFSIFEILIIIFSIMIAIFARGLFANIIASKIKKFVQKTINKIDDQLFDTLDAPLKMLPIIFVFILIGIFINPDNQLVSLIEKINQTLVTIFIFWLLHQILAPLSYSFKRLEEILSKALVLWLARSLKYLIVFLGIVAVLEIWGIKIGPVIAGMGLFGVAIALGAQDLFKNLISGVMIILEKRFALNDIIEVSGYATGSVEKIGFRSTIIRQFDSTPISIPNYILSDSTIINFTHRQNRRIKWIVGLTYDTSTNQLKKICENIESAIRSNENFVINDSFKLLVRVEKFSDSSIDILIHAFTNTNDWEKYLIIKEGLAFKVKEIVELNNSSFAFPSQSIYLEKDLIK